MLLVTTALEETWGTNENILFLGEWCKLFSRRNSWEKRNFITCVDPWSNRANRYRAYIYTQDFYEKLIPILTVTLNNYHKINQSERFWRILIGPWLQMFLNSVYHKWETIALASKLYDISKTMIYKMNTDEIVPASCKHFDTLSHTDIWNHYITAEVIKSQQNICVECCTGKVYKAEPIITTYHKRRLSRVLNKVQKFFSLIESEKRPLLINTYLNRINQIRLSLILKQFPFLSITPEVVPIQMKRTQRELFNISANFPSKFENFFLQLIKENIPTSYLEGFSSLRQQSQNCFWPASPKTISTANCHWADDVFKCYTGSKVDQGSGLKIIAHGGAGKFLYSDFQSHELSICDSYFTWGWKEYSEKCFRGYLIKDQGAKIKRSNAKNLTLITYSEFRYSTILSSMPSYEDFINTYLKDQITFIEGLKENVRKNTQIRLHYDLENNIEERLLQKLDNLNFSYIESDLKKLLASTKLVIGTYNCTNIVETIAFNIPTVIYWEISHWELAVSANPFFEKLRQCGIFHNTPQSAANHVNNIWENIEDWWDSSDVYDARTEFTAWFGRKSNRPLKELIQFLNS